MVRQSMRRALCLFLIFMLLPTPGAAVSNPAAALPNTWLVPAPNMGDVAIYNRSEISGTLDVFEVAFEMERDQFLVREPIATHGALGKAVGAHLFDFWNIYARETQQFAVDNDGLVVWDKEWLESAGQSEMIQSFTWRRNDPLCGLMHALQGAHVNGSHDQVLFPERCRRAHFVAAGGETWRPVRIDSWQGEPALAYQQVGVPGAAMVWFTESVPYPVLLLEQIADDRFAALELVRFHRGLDASKPPSTHADLPTMQLQPLDPMGPDAAGIDHPYHLSDALQRARQDEDVQAWLEARPTAYMRASWPLAYEESGAGAVDSYTRTGVGWNMWFDDGDASIRVWSAQQDTRYERGGAIAPTALYEDVREYPTFMEAAESTGGRAADLNTHMPKAATVRDWWHAFASDAAKQRPQAYGHTYWYHDSWSETRGAVLWGAMDADIDNSAQQQAWESDYIIVEADGRINVYVELDIERSIAPEAHTIPVVSGIDADWPTLIEAILRDPPPPIVPVPELPTDEALELAHPMPRGPTDGPQAPAATATESTAPSVPTKTALVIASAAAATAGLAWLLKLLFVAAFSRVAKDKALDHPVRQQILDAVQANPGIHMRQLQRTLEVSSGGLRHHVGKLVDTNIVRARKEGGYLCYYPGNAPALPAAGVVKSRGAQQLLNALQRGPNRAAALARAVGIAAPTARKHLQRMEAAGIVRRDGATYILTKQGWQAAA